jgi:GMP synthase-like glutamine amidotransferase
MRILIVDNNIDPDSWGAANLRRAAALVDGATIVVRRAPQDDLPRTPDSYDKVMISGSKTSAMADAPWISRLHEFIRHTIDRGKPLLGVCYGHQSLIRALGGKDSVRKGAEHEFGWTRIRQTGESSPLFKDVPQEFYTFSAHFEEVAALPKGMRLLARSESCAIQAAQLEEKPVFGIQFHPEKDIADAVRLFATLRKEGKPKKFLNPNASETLYDAKTSERLFRNFLEL